MNQLDRGKYSFLGAFLLVVSLTTLGQAYLVGHSLKLDQIESESDVIVKAVVISSQPVNDPWFEQYPGFGAYATQMKVISVIKGEIPEKIQEKIVFQHYGEVRDASVVRMFSPQYYEFERGKPYIIFAKKTETSGIFRQLWKNHKSKMDQGAIRAADAEPISKDKPIQEVVWWELIKLLNSAEKEDVIYAIKQLDDMSRATGWDKLDDFGRNLVMEKIHPFVLNKDPDIAQTSINALGNDSPYLRDDNAQFWLSHIGGRKIQGYAEWDKGDVNTLASKYWDELSAVVDGSDSVENRVLAIRSLGLVKKPEVFEHLKKWIKDAEPSIRRAAVILLSDYPGDESSAILTALSDDENAHVRYGVARAIGFMQSDELLPVLEKLLTDQDNQVISATVESILSFKPDKVEDLLLKHKNNPDFKPLFVNALAEVKTEPYQDELAEIIQKKLESKYFRGGTIPASSSWKILFKYIQEQAKDKIQSGDLDKYLDALENTGQYSSSAPRDLYAFYIYQGLTKRAKAFRERCKSTIPFDMEYYFKMVDEQSNYYINNSIRQNYDH